MYDPSATDVDRNLLFGILAVQADLISSAHFAIACNEWASRKDISLTRILLDRGWLKLEDQREIERLVVRKLNKHGGDVRACLSELTGDSLKQALFSVADPGLRLSLGPIRNGHSLETRSFATQPAPQSADWQSSDVDVGTIDEFEEREQPWPLRTRRWLGQNPSVAKWVAAVIVVGMLAALGIGILKTPLARNHQGFGWQREEPPARPLAQGPFRPPPGEFAPNDPVLSPMIQGLLILYDRNEDVKDHIRRDPILTEGERKSALDLVDRTPRGRQITPQVLNNASWFVVRLPDCSPAAYRRALHLAEAAVELSRGDGNSLNTLGVAQYRVGDYAQAVKTLTESDGINAKVLRRFVWDKKPEPQGSVPADLAFLAMGYFRLGDMEKARGFLSKLRAAVAAPGDPNRAESQQFLSEAELLIEGKTTPRRKPEATL
jgi:hypothetical protein